MKLVAFCHQLGDTRPGKVALSCLSHLPSHMVVPVLRGPLRGNKWLVGSCTSSCWLGYYEAAESAYLASSIASGNMVFDIGAQAGYHTLLASQLVGPRGQVFAFEPAPMNASNLRQHIGLNKRRNITVIEAAVSDHDGIVRFDTGRNPVSGHLSEKGALPVRSLSLDREIERGMLPEPDFMKIDVEGAEVEVLAGGREVLKRRHPTLIIETHQWMPDHASCHRDCCQLLEALGYDLSPDNSNDLDVDYKICAKQAG
jgi:FkbM family methyltransferase